MKDLEDLNRIILRELHRQIDEEIMKLYGRKEIIILDADVAKSIEAEDIDCEIIE